MVAFKYNVFYSWKKKPPHTNYILAFAATFLNYILFKHFNIEHLLNKCQAHLHHVSVTLDLSTSLKFAFLCELSPLKDLCTLIFQLSFLFN